MKNIKKDNLVIGLLVIFILFLLPGTFCNAALSIHGFYPVSSKDKSSTLTDSSELPHNPLYKEWCQKEFVNGVYIYEAYRQIAFNIEFTPEPSRVDLWQTPSETMRILGGDCEDAILLFHQLLLPHYNDGEIIWGIVHNLKNQTSFAHVWFQLYDKKGNLYIVEPFSGDWNGIIPDEAIKKSERRERIIGIPNAIISDILNKPAKHQDAKNFILRDLAAYDWWHVKEVNNVFTKLVNVSHRYRRQQR